MYILKASIATGLLLTIAFGPTWCAAQVEGQALVQARSFADSSLKSYVSQVIKANNATRFGFKDVAEAQAAAIGDPIPVLFIGLRTLKSYRAGAGAASVLTDAKTLWFPILANGTVVSKLEITEVQGKWLAGEFGRATLARKVAAVDRELPAALKTAGAGAPARTSLVRIPALSVELLYTTGTTGDYFVPVQRGDLPADVEIGKAYPADALLVQLAAAAQKVDENKVR
ncbi:MAG TPA: hypothetical protein VIH91_12985 [Terriglobales bacterium]